MRSLPFITTMLIVFVLSSCASGGENVPEGAAVEVQLTVAELENFDDETRASDVGKVGEVTGIVISSKRTAPNEKEMGSHFIYIYTKQGPNEKYEARVSCYTWGNPGLEPGNVVRLTGKIGKGAGSGYALLNCQVMQK
jgi:hypothetical protein